MLAEEITPTLEKLRLEKGNYLTYTANETKIERAERFIVANRYHVAMKSLKVGLVLVVVTFVFWSPLNVCVVIGGGLGAQQHESRG